MSFPFREEMSTVLRGNILHLANRLQEKQMCAEESSTVTPSLFSPPSLFPECSSTEDSLPLHTESSVSTESSSSIPSTLPSLLPSSNNSSTTTFSPWIRNAGRKKSHPVWEFFRDLKGENGSSSVVCMHCDWTGEDRSPNNLRTHLKKSHSHDGIFQQFSEKLANTPTQPYVKRVRAGGSLSAANNEKGLNEVVSSALSFLDSIPRMDQVIQITARTSNEDESPNETAAETSSSGGEARSPSSPSSDPPSASPSLSSTPFSSQLNSLILATNPLLYMNALANACNPPPFSLTDSPCICLLMKMAGDLDLTLSYHKRRGEAEVVFESNRTAEKSGGRGKVVALTDNGREIRVTERQSGASTESEVWLKTDVQQFNWAIRGKCAKVLK